MEEERDPNYWAEREHLDWLILLYEWQLQYGISTLAVEIAFAAERQRCNRPEGEAALPPAPPPGTPDVAVESWRDLLMEGPFWMRPDWQDAGSGWQPGVDLPE